MKVVVTGSASHLAQVLLPKLFAHPQVEQVVGIDINHSELEDAKFTEHFVDIRHSEINQHLHGADAVIHLAFVVMRGNLKGRRHDRALIHDINVNGSTNLFRAAQQQGVKHAVHLSSAVVYGAWADNPASISEEQILRAMPGFSYAEDKVTVEQWLEYFAREQGAPRTVILRPHAILGPNAQPLLIQLLKQPFYPSLPEPQPLSQCIWEDDVADAILLALFSQARGAFNLAADPALSFKAMQQQLHKNAWPLPYAFIRRLHKLMWNITGYAGEPGWVGGMQHSLAVSSEKAKSELNWQPKYSTQQCLEKLFKEL